MRVRLLSFAMICGGIAAQTPDFPVEEASIAGLHAAYAAGRVTARDVTQACLDRIAAFDKRGPWINSVITVNPRALEDAANLDAQWKTARRRAGLLHGIPVIVKDNIDVLGLPMTSGFQGWKNYYPPADAPLVQRIRAAGGIILGKASLTEFAYGAGDNVNSVIPGFCRNPYNTAFATGGSSGGTAAAVAASFAVVGIGTDTGGSVRMPSAHTALAGLRPTVGVVSRTGMVPLNSIRDTAGPMARSVADLAILLDAIAGLDPEDPATGRARGHVPATYTRALNQDALKGARLGVLRQVFPPATTDPRIQAHFETTLAELRAAGAEIVDPVVVPSFESIPRPSQTPARTRDDLEKWFLKHPGIPYGSVRAIADSRLLHPLHQTIFQDVAAARPVDQDAATLQGLRSEQLYRDLFTSAMDAARLDALVLPTWAQLPLINGDRNTQLVAEPKPPPNDGPSAPGGSRTGIASALQWPAITVPCGYLGEGLPQGLQIVGRAWDDEKIVGYAYAYEQATHYRRPPPTTPPLASSRLSRFVGTWKLVAVRTGDPVSGRETPLSGGGSHSQIIYLANGHFSLQGVHPDVRSSFGRWELAPAEDAVILRDAAGGVPHKRRYHFDSAGRLVQAAEEPPGNPLFFVWERLP